MTFIEHLWHAAHWVIQSQKTYFPKCFQKLTTPLHRTQAAHAQVCPLLSFWLAPERWGNRRAGRAEGTGEGLHQARVAPGHQVDSSLRKSPSLHLPFLSQGETETQGGSRLAKLTQLVSGGVGFKPRLETGAAAAVACDHQNRAWMESSGCWIRAFSSSLQWPEFFLPHDL